MTETDVRNPMDASPASPYQNSFRRMHTLIQLGVYKLKTRITWIFTLSIEFILQLSCHRHRTSLHLSTLLSPAIEVYSIMGYSRPQHARPTVGGIRPKELPPAARTHGDLRRERVHQSTALQPAWWLHHRQSQFQAQNRSEEEKQKQTRESWLKRLRPRAPAAADGLRSSRMCPTTKCEDDRYARLILHLREVNRQE